MLVSMGLRRLYSPLLAALVTVTRKRDVLDVHQGRRGKENVALHSAFLFLFVLFFKEVMPSAAEWAELDSIASSKGGQPQQVKFWMNL